MSADHTQCHSIPIQNLFNTDSRPIQYLFNTYSIPIQDLFNIHSIPIFNTHSTSPFLEAKIRSKMIQ